MIKALKYEIGFNGRVDVIDPKSDAEKARREKFVKHYWKLRERRGITYEVAEVLLARAQPAQVTVVKRRVGILLRIQDPHEDVGQRHEAVHLEGVRGGDRVVVGHVEQDQARQASLVFGVQNRVSPDAPLCGDP